MEVLLFMPALDEGKKFHHFPFGLLALGGALSEANIEYEIYDERVQHDDKKLRELLLKSKVIGVSMFTGFQVTKGVEFLVHARKINPDAVIIVGGPHATALPEQTAKSLLVDYVIAGYGESPFVFLVKNILSTNNHKTRFSYRSPGVYSKIGANVLGMPTPKKYSDIKWTPLPYEKIATDKYINPITRRVMYVTQYGCPAPCTFCATRETKKYTERDLDLVFKDLLRLDQLTNFKELCFFDATLFTRRARTIQIINFINQNFPGRSWLADARASELVKYSDTDFELISKGKMELAMLVVGLESGSKSLVESVIKKGRNHLENFKSVAEKCRKFDIKLTSGVVFGFPGETADDLALTNSYIHEIRNICPTFKISTTFFKPLPGTDLYDLVTSNGYSTPNSLEGWAEYGKSNHYNYNEWSNPPWMSDSIKEEYLIQYENFMRNHSEICI